MNLLYEIIFEKEINGKKFRMNVTSGSSYQECHDFCVDVMKKVMELAEQETKRQQEAASSFAKASADGQPIFQEEPLGAQHGS